MSASRDAPLTCLSLQMRGGVESCKGCAHGNRVVSSGWNPELDPCRRCHRVTGADGSTVNETETDTDCQSLAGSDMLVIVLWCCCVTHRGGGCAAVTGFPTRWRCSILNACVLIHDRDKSYGPEVQFNDIRWVMGRIYYASQWLNDGKPKATFNASIFKQYTCF